jgi:cytochrome c556
MKKVLLAIVVASFASTVFAEGHMDVSVISKRRRLMKELAGHAKAIGELIKAPNGNTAEIRKRARSITRLATQMTNLFAPGTGMDAITSPRTGARPEIWLRWGRFQAAARRLAMESERLGQISDTTGKAALQLQFAVTTMGGCGDCHRPFRKKLD